MIDIFQILAIIAAAVTVIISSVGLVISLKLQKLGPSHAAIRRMRSMTTSSEFEGLSGGECWVHWEFSDEAWAAWVEREFERDGGKVPDSPREWLSVSCVTALFGIMLGFPWGILRAALLGAVAFSLGVPLAWYFRALPDILHRKILRCPHEVYLGSQGMYFLRKFYPWCSELLSLKGADLVEGPPPELRLIMERCINGRYGMSRDRFAISLPIPPGCEAEAVRSAARLKARAG
jgi:hypothetical protein